MRIAFLTPLPPAKTGIAVYADFLLPALAKRAEVVAVCEQEAWETSAGYEVMHRRGYRRSDFDAVIYQLGNNPYHEWIYREAMEHPGVADLHDVVLHHLLVEMTLARGEGEAYAESLRRNHGAAGEAWARGRIAGWHDEIGNFLFPASIEVSERSSRVIVHNQYAAEVLNRGSVRTPVFVLDMPFPPPRAVQPLHHEAVVIGMFGFVTDAKRPHAVFASFAEAHRRDSRLRLVIVGEPAPNLSLERMAAHYQVPPQAWSSTGFVPEEEFDRYLAAVDRVINLRYPTAGETSGALLRVIHARKQVAVSDFGPFAEIPPGVVTRIPLGEGEQEALVDFMLFGGGHDPEAQRRWSVARADVGAAAEAYLRIVGEATFTRPEPGSSTATAGLPLFPDLRLEEATFNEGRLRLAVRNDGTEAILSEQYGTPGYRLIVKIFEGGTEVFDRWASLGGDLAAGARAVVEFPVAVRGGELRLYHGLQGVPDIAKAPFAVRRVGE
jgi:glycosyltransferase involved in cell wall biosynthesis